MANPSDIPSLPRGLRYVSDHDTGIRRQPFKGAFRYVGADGEVIKDEETLARIKALAIPPAWTDVWICADPHGHIQAVGRDAKGRKQYRYHTRWREMRDLAKYDRVLAFGKALPKLRARVDQDLRKRGLCRERVLAAVVALLETTLIRVGNEDYARQNKSFGLTTLRKRHAILGRTGAVFEFRGKSGVKHTTGFRDERLARVVRACQDLPGQRLFQYLDDEGNRHAVESADVNAYIREAMGEDFSAKDFRTWAGSLAAAIYLGERATDEDVTAKAAIKVCVDQVSRLLGNTPAVCRACYIHPRVLSAYEAGTLGHARAGANQERRLLKLLGTES